MKQLLPVFVFAFALLFAANSVVTYHLHVNDSIAELKDFGEEESEKEKTERVKDEKINEYDELENLYSATSIVEHAMHLSAIAHPEHFLEIPTPPPELA